MPAVVSPCPRPFLHDLPGARGLVSPDPTWSHLPPLVTASVDSLLLTGQPSRSSCDTRSLAFAVPCRALWPLGVGAPSPSTPLEGSTEPLCADPCGPPRVLHLTRPGRSPPGCLLAALRRARARLNAPSPLRTLRPVRSREPLGPHSPAQEPALTPAFTPPPTHRKSSQDHPL